MMREDWAELSIEQVFAKLENGKGIHQGWSPQCKKNHSPSEDIWGVLKTTAIQKNEFWDYENKELPVDKAVRPHLEVKAGDILLTCAGPRNRCGVACTVKKTRKRLLISGKMYRFRVDERLMTTEFMTLFLQTQESWVAIDKMKTGGNESGLNLTHGRFKELAVKIAPLPEQRAIVLKIEQLFSELDNGIANLKTAQQQLKVYRHSVLSTALEGPAETPIEDVITSLSQGWSPKCINRNSIDPEEWAVIKTSAIQHGEFLPHENKILPSELEPREQHEIEQGDILITRAGPRVRVGVCCLVKRTRTRLINCDKVYLLKLNRELILPEYFEALMNTPEYLKQIEKIKTGSSDSGLNLTQSRFKQLQIPLPKPSRQHQIVQEIESRLSVCDKLGESITQSLRKEEALRQSILKKAFEGRLLTAQELAACKKEKDWEPAGVLLERVKKEKVKKK